MKSDLEKAGVSGRKWQKIKKDDIATNGGFNYSHAPVSPFLENLSRIVYGVLLFSNITRN